MRRIVKLLASLSLLVVTSAAVAKDVSAHWSYEGDHGPENWGTLSSQYHMCSEGLNQSPVNLVADIDADLPQLEFEYYSSTINEINNGHTIQQNIMPGSFLRIPSRNKRFELKQFHFHSPSEHTVDGRSFAMELHFVHANEQGALAVVGVLIEEGEEHPVLKILWAFMPEHTGETSVQPIGIEDTDLLPPTHEYFTYAGSLTTPPCSEGVKWFVLKTHVEASAEQIAIFKKRVGQATNRPIQPNNARLIIE